MPWSPHLPIAAKCLDSLAGSKSGPRVYVDDVEANVVVAADLGMTALHFKDPETLRDDLRRLGFAIETVSIALG
jgi:hypothetical protein